MFVLNGILRAESQEKILLYLMVNDQGYGRSMAQHLNLSSNAVQKQLQRLETDAVIVSKLVGATRIYSLNPKYAFISPLKELLKCALLAYPNEEKALFMMKRNRPRKREKAVDYVSDDAK